ncbi:MAG: class I SAM-dependent methyltransferase [Cyanobacteria bacterium J06623_7]
MNLTQVKQIVGDLPYMSLAKAQTMADFIQENNASRILELGFYHGVSTCYMAAALEGIANASVLTIDLLSAEKREPNIEQLLDRCGYRDKVELYYEPVSYNWRLMKLIEANTPKFDLCYLDGGHDWYNTGYAFFLVDKLLNPGGWIIFDDLDWTMEHIEAKWALRKPLEERTTPQVRQVWELLVKTHPQYTNCYEQSGWGYAQKKAA